MIAVPFAPCGRRPAPFLDVFLMAVGAGMPLSCTAQLDTGADRTIVPQTVADQLRLAEAAPIVFKSVDGSLGTLPTYRLALRVTSFRPIFLTVAASRHEPHVLLGRDFSNKYHITQDGRARVLQVAEYPPT